MSDYRRSFGIHNKEDDEVYLFADGDIRSLIKNGTSIPGDADNNPITADDLRNVVGNPISIVNEVGTVMNRRMKLKFMNAEISDDEENDTTIITSIGGGGGGSLKLPDASGAAVSLSGNSATITWGDPADLVLEEITLAAWKGTRVIRKEGSAPTNRLDGELVVDNLVRNQYASNGFVDSGLEYGTTYYYGFFPYTEEGVYTTGSSVSVTPTRIVIANVPVQSEDVYYNGSLKTCPFSNFNADELDVTGNTGTEAGSYTATFTPKEGYCWSDNTITSKDVSWTVSRGVLHVPSSEPMTYNGEEQTANWDANYDSTVMSVTGNTGTNAGTYSAVFHILDSDNYAWYGGDTSDQTVEWEISKAAGSFSLDSHSVSINGINPEASIPFIIEGDGTLTAVSSDENVATCEINEGAIYIDHVNRTSGSATITVSLSATDNYTAPASQTISVTVAFSPISTTPSQSGTLAYDGTTKNVASVLANYDSTKVDLKDNIAVEAGTYYAVATPKTSYYWTDEQKLNVTEYIDGVESNYRIVDGTSTLSFSLDGVTDSSQHTGKIVVEDEDGNTDKVEFTFTKGA